MLSYNVTAARQDLYNIVDKALSNETVLITSKTGNVVMLSQDDYESLMETLYLMGDPDFEKDVADAKATPLAEREAWN